MSDELTIRRATPNDRPAILELLARSLGWERDNRFEGLFEWKHDRGIFGPSPTWVAMDDDRLAGVRVFLRWGFDWNGRTVRAVRAVDTATDPDYRGRGIFSRLTLHAVDEMRAEGVSFVFNTPNDQSRPGYLKMGWHLVGRLPASVRPLSISGAFRAVRSRVASERFSLQSDVGVPVLDVFDDPGVATLCESQPSVDGVRTLVGPDYLRWRFGWSELHYRAVLLTTSPADGLAVLRTRRRGAARETALATVLVPGNDRAARRALHRRVAKAVDADWVIGIGGDFETSAGYFPLPRQGPHLTWRALAEGSSPGPLGAWHLELGDVELF